MKIKPAVYSFLAMVLSGILAITVASRQLRFIDDEGIGLPQVSAGWPLVYFFGAVAFMSLTLAFLPLSLLRLAAKALFLVLFGWGVFVVLGLALPVYAAGAIAAVAALAWLRWSRLWLHDLLLGIALAGYGAVFGILLSPVAALLIMASLSVYDLISVRSGHMMWMVSKLTGVEVVPAFVFPGNAADWHLAVGDIHLDDKDTRDVSLLGGGDVGFSLIMVVSVLAAGGVAAAVFMGLCLLLGLRSVYWVQKIFFKGGPTPALPPLTVAATLGWGILVLLSVI
ncbi:MAG: presenilin family intramembrane aspartyl protease [Dehalogenimonas sp.]|uniref:Presenilin family intramembrane aspartyl protease n=1 Tax=Candidatus Dehalogenimonas loeffleri TaxID=3127115 RepID=A0ABZ2J5Q8_9CHLR|nr:presenilin family intramembrane aspartyl protease [Dehalogenimonas sp.]